MSCHRLCVMRLATSPSQNTGIDTPIEAENHQGTVDDRSARGSRHNADDQTAENPQHRSAEHQGQGDRYRPEHGRHHPLATVDEGGEVLGNEQPVHHQRILHRQRAVEAEIVPDLRERFLRGIAPGDARGGVGARRREEDEEGRRR